MEGLASGILIVLFFGFLILVWFGSWSLDKDRITEYVKQRGGRVISINWAPFGRGWFGEKNDRIYEVVYYDRQGNQHWATCKTSLFGGVFWTEDRTTYHKASWYDGLPVDNVPGDPVIRHVPAETDERVAAEALGLASPSGESAEEEIARLKRRIAELEEQQRESHR
jgi:hypothetical protein